MAFQHPARQAVQRAARAATFDGRDDASARARLSPERQQISGSWVLFSPPTDVTTTSYLSETDRSLQTPGRSQLSDLGSLNTVARSAQPTDAAQSPAVPALEAASVEDDAELDSLDSHLPEFRSLPGGAHHHYASPNGSQQALPVLPAHDGLGSFRLPDQPVLGREAQDHIYQFERFNPRRVRRRLDSFSRGQLDLEHGQQSENDARLRIEAWRLDHSRTLFDEVQREMRQRQKAQPLRRPAEAEAESDGVSWHDEDPVQPAKDDESLLARITRKVFKDLLGLEDRLLAFLLGDVPAELDGPALAMLRDAGNQAPAQGPSWELSLVEKVSRELGLLVNQLSHHPGAFSTFVRMQQMPLPYAGLPAIPESGDAPQATQRTDAERPGRLSALDFAPTMPQQSRRVDVAGSARAEDEPHGDEARTDGTFTQDEWEKDLDTKVVFKYLLSRFLGRPQMPSTASGRAAGAPTAQDSAAKMTRVRQHDPLIGRSRPAERRVFKATMPASPAALRRHSSCASQSTRRSGRRSSCSSRHYWDLGGSMGTGSVMASHGGMGSWGEV